MKKLTTLVVTTLALTLVAAGCGSKSTETGASPKAAAAEGAKAPAATSAEPVKAKKIIVGTGTQFPNVAFLDKDGKLTGYDIELVKELDKRLPEYEFEFKTMDFANLLLSLETNKIDFVAHEIEKNKEREEKYLFNNEPYAYWKTKVIVAKDNTTIKSIDDLKGKKALTTATSAEATLLENYNKANNNAIKIVYQSGAANDLVNQLTTGRVDGALGADFLLPLVDPQSKLKAIGPIIEEAEVRFLFRKNDKDAQVLADKIDTALKAVKADGTLSKLSTQWLGGDFTKKEDTK
ncbi:transporter substrate-binding domain-containing protein [Paenibacillus aceris]|uniref:L-cystine transport system substrate-binding protein n=1 Tax=Paenibacillus aceris TaxID=869555 RepID=A0ABS4I1L2_9BACL|nr:transporter substrate-binding domain-containing protein [Paenibacillus aceris]MBP1964688.1 L-cystine transport system substrate-binding protein [Paenibacillus aceris]NHW33675.1 transporter substrate-binding domain-containing protein [Paenibacillus aceris]